MEGAERFSRAPLGKGSPNLLYMPPLPNLRPPLLIHVLYKYGEYDKIGKRCDKYKAFPKCKLVYN